MMGESKKLNDQQLELIRNRYRGDGSPMGMLIDHINAVEAELKFDRDQETDRINRMWALVYPDDPTGWEYWDQVWRHVRDQRDELRQQVAALEVRLEKERQAWIDVQRRVQDATDKQRWREADVKRLREAAQKVLDDCKAVGVEPFGAAALRSEIAETDASKAEPITNAYATEIQQSVWIIVEKGIGSDVLGMNIDWLNQVLSSAPVATGLILGDLLLLFESLREQKANG